MSSSSLVMSFNKQINSPNYDPSVDKKLSKPVGKFGSEIRASITVVEVASLRVGVTVR
jgi:hypothetical protein